VRRPHWNGKRQQNSDGGIKLRANANADADANTNTDANANANANADANADAHTAATALGLSGCDQFEAFKQFRDGGNFARHYRAVVDSECEFVLRLGGLG
jgi:hypothetical protein